MANIAPMNGGIIYPANSNITQTGSRLVTVSLLGQQSNFNPWIPVSGYTSVTVAAAVQTGIPGGIRWNFTSPTGGGTAVYLLGPFIPIDVARTYLGKIWAAKVSGPSGGAFSAGYAAFQANGTPISGNGGTFGNFMMNGVTTLGSGGNFFSGNVYGFGTSLNSFPSGTAYVQLMVMIAGGTSTWQYSCSVPEFWEGPGYNAQSTLSTPSTVFNIAPSTPTPIAAGGTGFVLISIVGFLNHGMYAVGGSSSPTIFTSYPGGWINGGSTTPVTPAAGSNQGTINLTSGLLQITHAFSTTLPISVSLIGTGF